MTDELVTAMWVAVIAAAAAIVSAILSGLFSFYVTRRSSRQRMAEFRKEWIENLRTHLSEYGSIAYKRRVVKDQYDEADRSYLPEMQAAKEQMLIVNERFGFLHAYIRLNLNPNEPEHKALEEKMKAILDYDDEERNKEPGFVDLARSVLKKEWDRLKTEF